MNWTMMGVFISRKLQYRYQSKRVSNHRKRTDSVRSSSPEAARPAANFSKPTTRYSDKYPGRGRRTTDSHPGGTPTTVAQPNPSFEDLRAPLAEEDVWEAGKTIPPPAYGGRRGIGRSKVLILRSKSPTIVKSS